jgi:hypothetical protein
MANYNSFAAVENSAAVNISTTAETLLGAIIPNLPTGSVRSGRSMMLRASGRFSATTASAANSLTVKLYLGKSTTGTALVSASATIGSAAASSSNFCIEALLTWDSVSQALNGLSRGQIANVAVAQAALANAGASLATPDAMAFTASATIGVAPAAGNWVVQLVDFCLDEA